MGVTKSSQEDLKAPLSSGAKRYIGKKCGVTSKSEVKVKITAGQSFYFLTLDFYCRNALELKELLLISWRR